MESSATAPPTDEILDKPLLEHRIAGVVDQIFRRLSILWEDYKASKHFFSTTYVLRGFQVSANAAQPAPLMPGTVPLGKKLCGEGWFENDACGPKFWSLQKCSANHRAFFLITRCFQIVRECLEWMVFEAVLGVKQWSVVVFHTVFTISNSCFQLLLGSKSWE